MCGGGFGGGGGGGGSDPITQVVETVSDNTPTIKVEPPPPIKLEIPTLDEVVDTVSNVPDIKIIPEDLSDSISDVTPDIKIDTDDLTTGDEALTMLDQATPDSIEDVLDQVDENTPDIKIIPEDLNEILPSAEVVSELSEDISSATPDLIIDTTGLTNLTENVATGITDTTQVTTETLGGITTDVLQGDVGTVVQDLQETTGDFLTDPLGTTQEVLDHNSGQVMEAFNQTVDFVTNPVGTVEDAIDRGEDFFESVGEETEENVEAYTDVITDIGETAEEIGEVAQETMDTSMNVIGDTSANLVQALAAAGLLGSNQQDMMGGEGNAEAIMAGDPRMLSLMARRNQARKRGKAQLRKGGGLYIPVGTGLQVPA